MEDGSTPTTVEALETLEAFVSENPELEVLERLLAPFNIFEALGATWHELRHSDFLAYLLDPSQNHGLGAEFAKRLLTAALKATPRQSRPISPVDVDIWDLADLEVRREWNNIDIFMVSRHADLAVIVENKILSGEHDNQLDKYWSQAQAQGVASKLMGIYLSPPGDAPRDHEGYSPLGYATVCAIVEQMAETRASTTGGDVLTLLVHYAAVLRRHVLEDSPVADLARRIYKKHRAAIDLIIEHRPDLQQQIWTWLEGLIPESPELVAKTSSKRLVRFSSTTSSQLPPLGDVTWVRSGRVMVFEIENTPSRLAIKLIIGPGNVRLRQALFDWAQGNRHEFRPTQSFLGKSWNTIWQRELLSNTELLEDPDAIEAALRARWQRFLTDELPRLNGLLREFEVPVGLPSGDAADS